MPVLCEMPSQCAWGELGENEVVNVNTFEGGSLSFRIKRRESWTRAKFLAASDCCLTYREQNPSAKGRKIESSNGEIKVDWLLFSLGHFMNRDTAG
jgi:hypothetical protein